MVRCCTVWVLYCVARGQHLAGRRPCRLSRSLQPHKEACWVLGLRSCPQVPLTSAWGHAAALDVFIPMQALSDGG